MSRSARLLPFVLFAALCLAGCGSAEQGFREGFAAGSGQTTAASAPSPASASPAADPAARVRLPEVKGRNGAIVLDELRKAGLTNVRPASQDPTAKVVINAANWTVTRIEPGPGTEVGAGDTVVVTMTKQG